MYPSPYSVAPHSRDRLSLTLGIASAALCFAAFYTASLLPAYRSLVQLLGFAFLVAATYILARCRIPMHYSVQQEADGETWDLVIAKIKGKHPITLCRLAMQDIREIDIADRNTHEHIKKKYQNDTVHNYCPTLFPEQSLYLRFADSDPNTIPSATEEERDAAATRVVIRIAYDPTILAMLQQQL
jgi:hypothetical protein